jgi:hypothetical protein
MRQGVVDTSTTTEGGVAGRVVGSIDRSWGDDNERMGGSSFKGDPGQPLIASVTLICRHRSPDCAEVTTSSTPSNGWKVFAAASNCVFLPVP